MRRAHSSSADRNPTDSRCSGPQRRDAAPCLFVAIANHALRQFELRRDIDSVFHVIANCLELKAETSKALRKRIVHLMSQTLPLVKYGLHTPALHKEKSRHPGKGEKKYADYEFKNVSRTPPRRALQNFNIA